MVEPDKLGKTAAVTNSSVPASACTVQSDNDTGSCPICRVVLPLHVLPHHVDECCNADEAVVVVSLSFCAVGQQKSF